MKKLLLFVFFFFCFTLNVFATTPSNFNIYYNGNSMYTTNFFLPSANDVARIRFQNWYVYSATDFLEAGTYFKLAFCSGATLSSVSSYQYASDLNFYNTSAVCNLNSTPGYTGNIIYVTGEVPWDDTTLNAYCGANLSSCVIDSRLDITFKTSGYFQIINLGFSTEKYIYDSTNDTLISQNETIINSQNSINNNISNIDNTISNSTVDNPSNDIASFNQYLATNSTITNLIVLPVTLYQKVLNSLTATCSSYDAGELLGTHIIFPCIDISRYIGSTLWNVIDILMSGFLIFNISKHFIKVFDSMSSMKDGDVIDD